MAHTKFSILPRVITWQVFCSYVQFNVSSKSRGLGSSQDRSWQTNHFCFPFSGLILAEVKGWANYMLYVCVWREGGMRLLLGCGRVPFPFLSNRCGLATTCNFPAGNWERVPTTYMVVVLFLERPALLSAPRPQTRPSSCTAPQLRKGNLYSGEQARRSHTMLNRSTQPRTVVTAKNSRALQFTLTNSPNHNCGSGTLAFE